MGNWTICVSPTNVELKRMAQKRHKRTARRMVERVHLPLTVRDLQLLLMLRKTQIAETKRFDPFPNWAWGESAV